MQASSKKPKRRNATECIAPEKSLVALSDDDNSYHADA
jgi:hypothetical protein